MTMETRLVEGLARVRGALLVWALMIGGVACGNVAFKAGASPETIGADEKDCRATTESEQGYVACMRERGYAVPELDMPSAGVEYEPHRLPDVELNSSRTTSQTHVEFLLLRDGSQSPLRWSRRGWLAKTLRILGSARR